MQQIIHVEGPLSANSFKPGNAEANYGELMVLFDLADDLSQTVNPNMVKDAQAQLDRIREILNAVSEGADLLTDEYIHIMETRPERNKAETSRTEAALRRIFMALDTYRETAKRVKNIADALVEKLYAQMEKIVVIFMQLIDLSLFRIMQKEQLDELRARNQQIQTAFLLHNMAQQAHS